MTDTPSNSCDQDDPGERDPFTTGDEMLERAKQIAQSVDERIRKVTEKARLMAGDTDPQATPLNDTDEVPPVG